MKTKSTHTWGRDTARERYANGGPIATEMQRSSKPKPGTDKVWEQQGADAMKGLVSPTARQQFKDGSLGPMNITPKPIKGEDR